jgi:two-component system, NarL family, sensor kinase
MAEPARLNDLEDTPELVSILVTHAYRGVRLQIMLRAVLLAFMVGTLVFEPPAEDLTACFLIVGFYAVWSAGVALWATRGGIGPVRWMWIALVVDTVALGVLTLVAGLSARQSWAADILVNGLFLIPMLAATQLRPKLAAAVAAPATAVYLVANLLTQHANTEPLSSVLLRTFALAGLAAGCVALSWVQRSRVLTIAGLAADRAQVLHELVGVEARERARLAEHLHDGALQYVLAARQDLEDARDTGGAESFERIDLALTETATLLRSTLSDLHPEVLHQAGLERALADLVQRENDRGRAEISFAATGWEGRPASTGTGHDILYAAARELLTNAAKHADAQHIDVALAGHDGADELVVADDGRGLDTDALATRLAEGHIGLASLRARVAGSGGTMTLDDNGPSGTRVTISMPTDRSGPDGEARP